MLSCRLPVQDQEIEENTRLFRRLQPHVGLISGRRLPQRRIPVQAAEGVLKTALDVRFAR